MRVLRAALRAMLHIPLLHRSRFYLGFRGRETFYFASALSLTVDRSFYFASALSLTIAARARWLLVLGRAVVHGAVSNSEV